jgi:hypothetical protein
MRALLDNKYAPITFDLGFAECEFDRFSKALEKAQEKNYTRFGIQSASHRFNASLPAALSKLDPLASPADTYLLIETSSRWTAVFCNGFDPRNLLDPLSDVLSTLECYGLEIVLVPDRSGTTAKNAIRTHGNLSFTFQRWGRFHPTARIRHLAMRRHSQEWEFTAEGTAQAFEHPKNHQNQVDANRLTPEIIEEYCAALDIRPFDSAFYRRRCLLSHWSRSTLGVRRLSLAEARSRLYL